MQKTKLGDIEKEEEIVPSYELVSLAPHPNPSKGGY